MTTTDVTHDARRQSWVASANGHTEFPLQNLPLGIFTQPGESRRRGGVAIGDEILDLGAALEAGLLAGEARRAAEAGAKDALNELMALGASPRQALRARLFELLAADGADRKKAEAARGLLLPAAGCAVHLPARIGDYTDFYAGIHHALAVGKLFRPDNPLLPNYKHVPIAYHGRASSIVASGTAVRRPNGQRKLPSEEVASFGPARNLDFELELGTWIGEGNGQGEPVPIGAAGQHIAGFCLLNDWSARDIQAWEYQPLGPFLAKNFATTISPWVVTPEALAPFRIAQPPRPAGDPAPLAYLMDAKDQAVGALDLDLEVSLLTPGLREKGLGARKLSVSNARHLYWTVAQMVAHHTSGGCNLASGDLFGSGTISGTTRESLGSLLEVTESGKVPIALASGETRRFLEDGDEVILTAHARRAGFAPIGFGECRGRVVGAR